MNLNLGSNMDIATTLSDLKLVTSTQVDLSYFNHLAGQIFSDSTLYANIQSDIQFINQIGGQLFNYFSNPNPNTQKVWYIALAAGLTEAITDAGNLITAIPADSAKGADLTTVLNIFVTDCKAIQAIIPVQDK
jgi:hypothetical protein